MKVSVALLIVCIGLISGMTSAEFGRTTSRQTRQEQEIADTELIFRTLAEEDALFFYSMSMSMSLSMSMSSYPILPTTTPASSAPTSSAPTDAPIVPVMPAVSDAPSSTSTEGALNSTAGSVLSSDAMTSTSLSRSPMSTAFVAVASVGGIIVAALAIRRSRKKGDYEDFDAKKDGGTIDDELSIRTDIRNDTLNPSVAGGNNSVMAV